MKKIIRILILVASAFFAFVYPILQGSISNTIDLTQPITLLEVLKNKWFWIFFSLFIVWLVLDICVKKGKKPPSDSKSINAGQATEQSQTIIDDSDQQQLEDYAEAKKELIKETVRKVREGDYEGASEIARILKMLDDTK